MTLSLSRKKHMVAFYISALAIMAAMIWFGVQTEADFGRNPLTNVSFPHGTVVEVLEDRTSQDDFGMIRGSSRFLVEINTGTHRGLVVEASNIMFIDAPVNPQVGTTVVLSFETGASQSDFTARIHSYSREAAIYIIILLFFGLIILIGGKSGISSVFGLVFTFVTLLFLLVPAIVRGASPALMTVLLSILIVAVSLISVLGLEKKTWASIIGTIVGIGFYALFYAMIAAALRISGFSIPEMSQLMAIGFTDSLRISELLFCGILIASLGAVMDTAVSVASATAELSNSNASAYDFRKLLKSALRVVKDCVGSSANTLILAFTGTFFISLILFRLHELNYTMLINRVDIAIEVLRAVSASAGMIIAAPATALVAAKLYSIQGKSQVKSKLKAQKR